MGGFNPEADYIFGFSTQTDVTAPNPPTNLSAFDTPGDNGSSIDLTWTGSSSPDVERYIIYRSLTSGSGYETIASIGNQTSHTDTYNIVNGLTYYYVVRAMDEANNLSGPSNEASALAKENITPGNVSNVQAIPADSRITLTWINPSDPDFSGVRILRKTSGYPQGINDGTLVYIGGGTSYEDLALTNGIVYYYRLFAFDTSENYASGVNASAMPQVSESEESNESPVSDSQEGDTYTYIYPYQGNTPSSTYGGQITPASDDQGEVLGAETNEEKVESDKSKKKGRIAGLATGIKSVAGGDIGSRSRLGLALLILILATLFALATLVIIIRQRKKLGTVKNYKQFTHT